MKLLPVMEYESWWTGSGHGELVKNGLTLLHGEKTWLRRSHFADGLDTN